MIRLPSGTEWVKGLGEKGFDISLEKDVLLWAAFQINYYSLKLTSLLAKMPCLNAFSRI